MTHLYKVSASLTEWVEAKNAKEAKEKFRDNFLMQDLDYAVLDCAVENNKRFDERHGGPFDRGGADYYYGRGYNPHFYKGGTYSSDRVDMADMTKDEIAAYRAGYNEAENSGDQKDWGDDG